MSNRIEPATRHYDEKLQLILKASARIFAEKSFHHTSVRDIARATKMSLSGLYYYFTTKEELLYLVVRDPIRQAYSKLEEIVTSDAPVKVKIAQAIVNHMTLFHQHYPHIAVYLHDYHHLMQQLQ